VRKNTGTDFIVLFGKNLIRIRKGKKMSMEKLTHKSNMEYCQISRIDRGQINTSIRTAMALEDSL